MSSCCLTLNTVVSRSMRGFRRLWQVDDVSRASDLKVADRCAGSFLAEHPAIPDARSVGHCRVVLPTLAAHEASLARAGIDPFPRDDRPSGGALIPGRQGEL